LSPDCRFEPFQIFQVRAGQEKRSLFSISERAKFRTGLSITRYSVIFSDPRLTGNRVYQLFCCRIFPDLSPGHIFHEQTDHGIKRVDGNPRIIPDSRFKPALCLPVLIVHRGLFPQFPKESPLGMEDDDVIETGAFAAW